MSAWIGGSFSPNQHASFVQWTVLIGNDREDGGWTSPPINSIGLLCPSCCMQAHHPLSISKPNHAHMQIPWLTNWVLPVTGRTAFTSSALNPSPDSSGGTDTGTPDRGNR